MSTRLLATFATWERLAAARASLREIAPLALETYSPMPPPADAETSPLSIAMLLAGLGGFVGFFGLMAWADLKAYPMDIGGRPDFAWPTFVPIAFELAVLCAMVAGFVGWFVLCRRPKLYDPIDEADSFGCASRDGYLLDLRAADPVTLAQARHAIARFEPDRIEELGA